MKRPHKARDTSWQLLRDMRSWFDRVRDNDDEGGSPAGINYLNGDSDRYHGWLHAEQLRRRLNAYLNRAART